MIPTFEQCMAEVNAHRVAYRESDDGHYCIFNYIPDVEFKDTWNDVNVWCRGLIFDRADTSAPVAVPFKKFWNVGQKPQTRPEVLAGKGLPVAISTKIDGSLGIIWWDRYTDRPRVSTRGSLESDQAKWATKWLNENITPNELATMCHQLTQSRTAVETILVEIVYAENRIVVKYDFEGLVYLDCVLNCTGQTGSETLTSLSTPASWRRASSHVITSVNELLDVAKNLPGMEEGFVVTYADGLKVKVKGAEYIRLHRIRFDLTPRRIHELLAACADPSNFKPTIDNLLCAVPDEFADPVRDCATALAARFTSIMSDVEWHVVTAKLEARGERKKTALYCKANLPQSCWAVFFSMLDDELEKARVQAWNAVDYADIVL